MKQIRNLAYFLSRMELYEETLITLLNEINRLLKIIQTKTRFECFRKKYITGIPDHEDFEQQNTEKQIIKEQDRQININTAVHMQTGNLMQKVNLTLSV